MRSVYSLRPDGHSRKRSLQLGWMRSSRQYPCRDFFLSNRDHISRSGYPFQPITYLSRFSASCIVLQKYYYSSPSCHRQSTNTVFWSTRRVIDRSSRFLTESWRSHPAACPFGQRRKFPRHPDYSVVKDQTREKVPSLGRARENLFLNLSQLFFEKNRLSRYRLINYRWDDIGGCYEHIYALTRKQANC